MNAYQSYQRAEPSAGWTRIDMLLALYDGALERLGRAETALKANDRYTAVTALTRTQLILSELAAGVRMENNETVGPNILRLYEFASNELRTPRIEGIANARKVLNTLREGFESVRVDAVEMERSGQLRKAENLHMVHAQA